MLQRIKFKALCLMLLFLFLAACGRNSSDMKSQENKNTPSASDDVSLCFPGGDWGYPSPFAHYPRGPGGFKMCLIFDSLLERDEKGLIPWLAEKYEIKENGRVYIFTLRDGVLWQDGTPLNVDDVRFSIGYASRHPMTWSYVFDAIETIETGPGNTLKIVLKHPSASMLYNLGMTRIIPRHIWEKVTRPKEFTAPEAVIGSGPYKLTHYSKEHGIYKFEAYDKFWGPKQRVRQIAYIPVSEEILAYENREIDMASVSQDLLPRFRKNSENKIVRSLGFWGYRLLFNMDNNPVLRDKRIRQAFAYAIDLNELVEKIARGAAIPGSAGILPPDHVMAAKGIKTYPLDTQKAKSLLIESGFQGENTPGERTAENADSLQFDLLCSSQEVRMAEILQQRLADVGISIKIKSVDGKTRDTRVRSHDYQLAIIGHGGWGHDPEYLAAHFSGRLSTLTSSPSGSGLKGFNSPDLMRLLDLLQTEIDVEKRKKIVDRIQALAAEEVPEIPLFYTTGYTAYRPQKYDGWMFMFDHHSPGHSKLSYLERSKQD